MSRTTATVVISDYSYARGLKALSRAGNVDISFPSISPVYDAYDDMVRDQRYDVCELAIGAFLQAHRAGKPLRLLPVIVAGHPQYKNLYATPRKTFDSPADLAGGRIGVRSYSQTTGLWVRAWLAEDFGVQPEGVTWVVTEGSHLAEYEDPENVELVESSLVEELAAGRIDAAIIGGKAAPPGPPMLADHAQRDRMWFEKNGFVPINHLVAVTTDFETDQPDAVRAIYRTLADGIDEVFPEEMRSYTHDGRSPTAIRHGLQAVGPAVALAARYAYEQGLISEPIDDIDSLFAFNGALD